MKLGILGGSFAPVHNGHIFLAEKALAALKLDRVVFIPAYRSPFKLDAQGMEISAKDRIDMLAASIVGDHRFAIDICEIRREGISYTINTLEDIIERYLPTGKPALIIGDDIAEDFPKWRESDKILKLADIVIAHRVNSTAVNYPFANITIENEILDVSSHEIRQMISESGDWQRLVPPGAAAIITDRKLYGYNSNSRSKTAPKTGIQHVKHAPETVFQRPETALDSVIQRVETAARETLSTERFLHSRNTALHAFDLCRRFGLDPMEGYLAGIGHDLAKQIDNKQMLKIVKTARMDISALEADKPNLLHGKAAAVLLREQFSIHNEDVLEAVAIHTSGDENMGPLAKIIFIADKTEASRNIEPALRRMCREDTLDNILFAVLEKSIAKVQAKGMEVSEDTLRLLKKLKERKN
ncbi:nicotinate-nucleotide adenylyltransferase [Treponema sp. R8-4-B8]